MSPSGATRHRDQGHPGVRTLQEAGLGPWRARRVTTTMPPMSPEAAGVQMNVHALALPLPATSVGRGRGPLGILIGGLVLFAILQGGLTLLVPRVDLTLAAIAVTVAMLLVVIGIERWVYGRDLAAALRALGYGRARPQAIM